MQSDYLYAHLTYKQDVFNFLTDISAHAQ